MTDSNTSLSSVNDGQISRIVKVDRTRSSQDALEATGRTLYGKDRIIATMPNGVDEEVEVIFFKLGCDVYNDTLMSEYQLRSLDPVDPYTLAAVNEADVTFATNYPNCTHWKTVDMGLCFAAFTCFGKEPGVSVDHYGNGWGENWWFAGVRKKTISA